MFKRVVVLALAACAVVSFSGCGGGSPSPSVTVSASSSTVDGADAVTLTGTVTNDKNSAGVSWSVTSGGGTLSNTTTTSATYTAPAATSSQQSITITATSIADTTKAGTVTLTVPAAPTVTTTSANLTGAVGSTFSVKLQASGGIAPFTWALGSGTTLPGCLTLKSDGTLTTTSGTAPTASCAGSYTNLTFKATDSGTATPLSVTSSPLTATIAAAPAISFGAAPTTTGTFNIAYASAVTASGGAGPLTYSLASGALPPNVGLSASGAITGTPKAADVGTFTFAVTASDAFGDSAVSSNYTITISYPALTVNSVTPPTGYAGSVYTSTTLTAAGGNGGPYTWTWAAASGSSLPPGLGLSTAGVITGTPTTTGTYNVVVTATDSASNAGHATIAITVKPGVTIGAITLPTGYVGSPYPATGNTLSASGGAGAPYTWSWVAAGGSILPGGLSIGASTGAITGIPTTVGSYSVVITARDSATPANTASVTLSITIGAGVSITPPTLTNAYNGTPYTSAAFTASGGSGAPYTWSATGLSGSGLSINSSTGVISGTPTNSGSTTVAYHASVTATDSSGNNQASVNATINVEASVAVTSPATLPGVVVGVNPNYQLTASGGSGSYTTWTVTSGATSLTAVGLSVSSSGVLTGPNPQAGTANFAVTVTDSESHTSTAANLSVTVSTALTITTASLPAGNAGSSYTATLAAGGGSGTYTNWQVLSMTGAVNLAAISLNLNTSTGVISGTPSASGTYSITIQVTDSASHTASQTLNLTLYPALTLPASNSLPGGYTNVAYSGSIQGSGGSSSISIAITSALSPANGTLAAGASGATVSLSGTPTAANTESISVKLTDTTTTNFITQTYSFSITAASAPVLPASSLPNATVSQAYGPQTITATGGVGPNYTWTVNSTVLTNNTPMSVGNGLTVQTSGNNQLSISGTPSSTTQVQFPVTVKDNTTNLTSAPVTYTITVNSSGYTLSGQITLITSCPGGSVPMPIFDVTTGSQTAQSDNNGNYSIPNVPNGTYILSVSLHNAPTGSNAFVVPSGGWNGGSLTVNNANQSGLNFQAQVTYTVSGTVSYSGTHNGWIYLNLVNSNCSGQGGNGTALAYPFTSGGAYTIRGVQEGSYTLQAWMDPSDLNLGQGQQNTSDPAGSSSVTVGAGNATSNVTLNNNNPSAAPSSTPRIKAVFPGHGGAFISYKPALNNSGVEDATSYVVGWSTSSTLTGGCLTTSGTKAFPATGDSSDIWILNNADTGAGTFTDGTTYYFQIEAQNSIGTGSCVVYGGSSPTGVTMGTQPGANTITGNVTIPSGITCPTNSSLAVCANAQLYVGFYSQTNGVYGVRIASPAVGSSNAFTLNVPSGNWQMFAILDQNNNGSIDVGDVTNVNVQNGPPAVTISGSGTQNVSLPGTNSITVVATQYSNSTFWTGSSALTSIGYTLTFAVAQSNKLPVAVTLNGSSLYSIGLIDLGNYCQGCGSARFEYNLSLFSGSTSAAIVPHAGDSYSFTVTYSDGSTNLAVPASVTGWNGGGTVVGASDAPTNLAPTGSGSNTTPTFTWTDPVNSTGNGFEYSFYINQNSGSCPGSGCTIWQIPGNNSNTNGFSSSTTSLTWGTDPTGGGSTPTVGSLTAGDNYGWSVQVTDPNNNQATTQTYYIP